MTPEIWYHLFVLSLFRPEFDKWFKVLSNRTVLLINFSLWTTLSYLVWNVSRTAKRIQNGAYAARGLHVALYNWSKPPSKIHIHTGHIHINKPVGFDTDSGKNITLEADWHLPLQNP